MRDGDKIVIVERPEQYNGLPTFKQFVTVYEVGAIQHPVWRKPMEGTEVKAYLKSLENVQRIIYT